MNKNDAKTSEKTQVRGNRQGTNILVALIATCVLVSGCTGTIRNVNAVKFDGHYFSTRTAKTEADPMAFTARVRNATKSIAGAREAARYEATIHCVEQFGTSDIVWSIGPEDENISLVNGALTLAGRCDPE